MSNRYLHTTFAAQALKVVTAGGACGPEEGIWALALRDPAFSYNLLRLSFLISKVGLKESHLFGQD